MTTSWTGRLARSCALHPWRVVTLWLLALVGAFALVGGLLSSALTTEGDVTTDPEAKQGLDLLEARWPDRARTDELVVVRSERLTVEDAQFAAYVRALRRDLDATGVPRSVGNPLAADGTPLVSKDRHAVLLPVTMPDKDADPGPEEGIDEVVAVVQRADVNRTFDADITGVWTTGHDFLRLSEEDLQKGELQFGLPAALVILLLVFGAVVAAVVPLLMAVVSILVSLAVAALVGQVLPLSFFLVNMVTAMGLALGIDYSLFVLSRYREERHHGLAKLDAVTVAGGTASKAVFFSGSAFVVALLGMLLVPDTILRSLAFGAVVVGVVTVASAVTLLPAVMSLLGDRVNALRVPLVSRTASEGGESRFWLRAVHLVMRRPGLTLGVTTAALLALAVPVIDLDTGQAGVTSMPEQTVSRQGYEALQASFPTGNRADPAQVVVDGPADAATVTGSIDRLRALVGDDDAFGEPTVAVGPSGDLTLVEIPLVADANSTRAEQAVLDLRERVVPQAFGEVDADVLVTGTTALLADYTALISTWLPIVLAFVLALSFMLLTVVFRSVVLAAKAVALNLLSVGAAYGLLVLVFQKGVGADLLGFQQVEQVEAWLPVFLFSVLFALSMDYHVFLLTRIRERYLATGDTEDAVAHGIGATGRIITGAALIIVTVFGGFATGELAGFQQMGFGVGVALLLDATVIRTVVVPASMALLGRWNWYLPGWLQWLPEVHVEGSALGASGAIARPATVPHQVGVEAADHVDR